MEELFKHISEWGLSPFMITGIVLWSFTLYILKDALIEKIKSINVSRLWNWAQKSKDKSKNTIKMLSSHDIFNTLTRVKQEVMFQKFFTNGEYDATKTRMCIDFTNNKSDVCYRRFMELIEKDLDNVSADVLKKAILNEMNEMHGEYILKTRNMWLQKGIKIDDVDYIIELFERFRYDVIVSFQHRIDAIFSTEYYISTFDKMLACYDMFAMGIDLLPRDMLTTFEALNGKFKEIKYV